MLIAISINGEMLMYMLELFMAMPPGENTDITAAVIPLNIKDTANTVKITFINLLMFL